MEERMHCPSGCSTPHAAMIPLGKIYHFTPEKARQLLHNKFVVILGDSIHRAVYKDMIYFLQKEKMLTDKQLKLKTDSFANDCLVEGGKRHNKTSYCEARQYRTDHHLIRYYFLTRIYSAYAESILSDFKAGPPPDVVILNSCLWDLNRYNDGDSTEGLGKAFREYWQNLDLFLGKLKDVLPPDCLVIWDTAMPLGWKVEHAYLESGMKNQSTPIDILRANFYSATLACCYEFDVLDLHYSFRFLENKRAIDGVHWDSWVHRYITELLLTHMAIAWGVEPETEQMIQGIELDRNAINQSDSSQLSFSPPYLPQMWPRLPPPSCPYFGRPPPHFQHRLQPPPHLRPRMQLPPPHLRLRMPLPHLWPRMQPPPPPLMFLPCSEFDKAFPPFQSDGNPACHQSDPSYDPSFHSDQEQLEELESNQIPPFYQEDRFSPRNDPDFQCDFSSNHAPLDKWEGGQLPPSYSEDRLNSRNDPNFQHDFNSNHPLSADWEGNQFPLPYPEETPHNGFWGRNADAPNPQQFPPHFQPEMPRGAPRGRHNHFMRRQHSRRRRGVARDNVPFWEMPPFPEWGPSC